MRSTKGLYGFLPSFGPLRRSLISVRSEVQVFPGPLRGTGLPQLVLRDWPEFRLAPISGFVSVLVSIGPVIGPIQGGRFRHSLKASTADRAPYQGFRRVLAGIRFNLHLNGVQGVAAPLTSGSGAPDELSRASNARTKTAEGMSSSRL